MLQLNELEEFKLHAYDNAKLYQENTKMWNDKHIMSCTSDPKKRVLVFNLKLKLFPSKLMSQWYGPFEVVQMNVHGFVELIDKEKGKTLLLNGQIVKHYYAEKRPSEDVDGTI